VEDERLRRHDLTEAELAGWRRYCQPIRRAVGDGWITAW